MGSGPRFAIISVLLAAVGGTVALTSGGDKAPDVTPTTSPSPGPCITPPPAIAMPAWFPDDLPLPEGTHQVAFQLRPIKGYKQAVFVTPVDLSHFVQHALGVWPKKGWVLGRGDAEPGEAEDTFTKTRERRYGAFRASSGLCDPNTTFLYIVLGTIPSAVLTPSPSGTPLQP